MNQYLDVGVNQIQSWLARTPKLRGRRGASTMIREATRREAVSELIAGLAEINPEQGAIDGVISLRLLSTAESDRSDVERRVVDHLRRLLPAAMLRSKLAEGDDYAGSHVIDERFWPAAVQEWPLARPCDWCHNSPSTTEVRVKDQDALDAVCADCAYRSTKAGYATSARNIPGPEQDLLERLGTDRAVPDEFGPLAELGTGRGDDLNHVATIFADGNQLGRYISTVRRDDPGSLSALPERVHEATWAAVLAGVHAIDTGTGDLPVIAHLVGGDDILVTVPAHDAWRFVTAMTTAFHDALADSGPTRTPTLSAGVVIHHHSYPLAATVDLVTDLLRQAKGHSPGEAVLRWHSVTHDGPRATQRAALPVEVLRAHDADLQRLAATPASQRQQLAWFTRTDDPGLAEHIARLELTEVVMPFLHDPALPLRDALDLVQWWRA